MNSSFSDDPPLGPITTPPATPPITHALLVRTEDFDPQNSSSSIKLAKYALSIFFYRVDFNKMMRASWGAVGHLDGRAHLPLDLHFLLTAWAPNAEAELLILGRAMQCLETTPMLGGPMLHAYGGFAPNESIQIVLEEISTEAVMRTFDSLPTSYKLSVPYIARVARIDGKVATPSPPVLTAAVGAKPEASP